MSIKKISKWFAITLGSFIIAIYLFFIIALNMTASGMKPTQEAHDAIYAESMEPHKLKLIDSGILSLKERLNLIKNARKSIELEFFIYNIDTASRLVTQALLQKAKEGVEIRLLVDFSAPVFQLRPVYAQLMESGGIKIKYYNTTKLYNLFSVQHRSHRKLLIIDGEKALTGGRNIADDYFDLSHHYNFLDSDVLIQGPIVKNIQSSFDLYWNSDLAADHKNFAESTTPEELGIALVYLKPQQEDFEIQNKMEELSQNHQLPEDTCLHTIFVTDFPGVGESHRKIYPTLLKLIAETKKEIYVESPYFVLRQEGYDVFKKLVHNKLKVKVLTNGLYSTDAYYVISPLWLNKNWISKIGLDLYLYQGDPLETNRLSVFPTKTRWGIHAKRAVLDEKTALIGTYNIDPRSANLNSEVMLVCKDNPEFASRVLQSIQARIHQSSLYMSEQKILDDEALMRNASFQQKLMTFLAVPIASTFDFIL